MLYRIAKIEDMDDICVLIDDAIREMESDEEYNNVNWSCTDETAYVLHRFCVSPSFQNRGIGKKVLIHVEEQIKNMGYESVRLDVFSKNPFAQKLYRTNGYEVRGYVDWRKGRFDLMEKKL